MTPFSQLPGQPGGDQAGPTQDISGLLGGSDSPQSAAPDPSMEFMQLAKALEDQAMTLADQYPEFSASADAIKKAIQDGTSQVIGSMRDSSEGAPGYMG